MTEHTSGRAIVCDTCAIIVTLSVDFFPLIKGLDLIAVGPQPIFGEVNTPLSILETLQKFKFWLTWYMFF